MVDLDWPNSHFGAVYEALSLSLEPSVRNVVPGTERAIGRALFYFRGTGEAEAVEKLATIALIILRLQNALRSRSEDQYLVSRHELAILAWEWLRSAPMFPRSLSFETALAA